MSSSRALCCLTLAKKQKYDFNFCRSIYNKTIIRFGFCDIQNNQGLGKGYLTSTTIILDITKTSSNNCLMAAQGEQSKFPATISLYDACSEDILVHWNLGF